MTLNIRNLMLTLGLIAMSAAGVSAQEAVSLPKTVSSGSSLVESLTSPESNIQVFAPAQLLERTQAASSSDAAPANLDADDALEAAKPKANKSVGFRVQVFADNNPRTAKAQARQRENAIKARFPQYASYVAYSSPYWRVRIGDFRNEYEADKAATEIKRAFPAYAKEVRVIRDHINP